MNLILSIGQIHLQYMIWTVFLCSFQVVATRKTNSRNLDFMKSKCQILHGIIL